MPFDLINPEKPDPILKLLIGAHDFLLDEKHWCQGSYHYRGDGSRCAIGALVFAAGTAKGTEMQPLDFWNDAVGGETIRVLAQAIPRGAKRYYYMDSVPMDTVIRYMNAVMNYNDAPRRKHADVLKLFNAAISLRVKQLTAALAV
jgi:hypothetical protein